MTIPRFWREAGSRYRMVGSKCNNCNRIMFPRRSFCPVCHRESMGKMEDIPLKGKGVVESFSIVHNTTPANEDLAPYVIAIIRMEEGLRLTSQVVGVEPSQVKVGMEVTAAFRKLGEDGPSGVIHYGFKFVPTETSVSCTTG